MAFGFHNFVLFSNHCRYFHFVFFWRGAISEIPRLFEIWRDPKIDNTMYKKDMLKNWSSPHLLDYGWYLNCPKENILPLKFKTREKHEPKFLQGLRALEKETPTKKRLEGGKRKGKKKIQEFGSKMQDDEDVPTQS